VVNPETIEQWIKEAAARPDSAGLIIQQIALRLNELSGRNEELAAENIALQSGAKVEEYERRIAHLEYQLVLIRRQVGGQPGGVAASEMRRASGGQAAGVLSAVYDSAQIAGGSLQAVPECTCWQPDRRAVDPDALRLLVAHEELLFISLRQVAALALENIPLIQPGDDRRWDWELAPGPSEPNAGERLACLAPIGRMAVAECFVQVSRKGCVKKIRAGMGQTILANHYIGAGVRQPPDQTFNLLLCANDALLALATNEGYVQCVEVKSLPPSVEEALRLESSDHLVDAFLPIPGQDILAITQVGKAVHWTAERLEVASSYRTRGQALYSASRREQGVRVVAAASVSPGDWGAALHRSGRVSLHAVDDILRSGALPVEDELLAFTFFSL
jgi:hypothetical protein